MKVLFPMSATEKTDMHLSEDKETLREQLIELCEQAVVPVSKWSNRDTPSAQMDKVGTAWALLKAGCDFDVVTEGDMCVTNDEFVWFDIVHPTFSSFETGEPPDVVSIYLPTPKRLNDKKGDDWYG